MACGKKCMRGGPVSNNGYVNFLREFRKKCCGMSAVQSVRAGACAWNKLTCKQNAKYKRMDCKTSRRRKPKKYRMKSKKSPTCRPKPRKCGC